MVVTDKKVLLSIVIPIYQGQKLLDHTFEQVIGFERQLPESTSIEIIAVDDGSSDDSFEKIIANQKKYPGKIKAVRLARNFGAIVATQAGIEIAHGDCITNIPQDLQEPLELFLKMYHGWGSGIKINLGYREFRDEPFLKRFLSACYHHLFHYLVLRDLPKGGLCAFLIDKTVADTIRSYPDTAMDLATRLFTMGNSRCLYPYRRYRPPHGTKSNWTLAKNFKLAIDNFITFSYLPVRVMSFIGLLVALLSFLFATYVFVGKVTGWYAINQPPGWATIVVLISFLLGLIMTMLGIIGEYLWRILDTVRKKPPYIIDEIQEK